MPRIRYPFPALLAAVASLATLACDPPVTTRAPLFIEGRPVAPAGDSVFGAAAPGGPLVLQRRAGPADSLGGPALHDPVAVQYINDAWWVSDVEAGVPAVVRLQRAGVADRVTLGAAAAQPHQFAVLPEGDLVYETRDQRLVRRRGDSVETFAVVEAGPRPSMLVGARGGVLHAVPDRHITLYNAFGHVRWRIEWPWIETAHVAAIAVDGLGRIQILSGVAAEGTFIVYTVEPTTGEVTRWSEPDSSATFVVDRVGEVSPDARGRWRLR